jgi:hypothetical protein
VLKEAALEQKNGLEILEFAEDANARKLVVKLRQAEKFNSFDYLKQDFVIFIYRIVIFIRLYHMI